MKRLFILILIILPFQNIFSQDLIVTKTGDSINCKITKVDPNTIFFLVNRNLEIKNTFLAISEVTYHQYKFFPRSLIPYDYNSNIGEFKHLQISIDGGFSIEAARLSESIPEELKDYYEKLKSGYNLNARIDYYFDKTLGIGIKYLGFYSSNKINNVNIEDQNGTMHNGRLSDNLKISFYGASFTNRSLYGNGQSSFYSSYYFGYVRYEDDAVMYYPYKISGNTIGMGIEGGYDVELFDNFLIGFQASALIGAIKKLNVNDGHSVRTINLEKGSYESLFRVDFSIGIRFKL